MLLPLRLGNSNRSEYIALRDSMLNARGDALSTQVGSAIWVETVAYARMVYNIWLANQKMQAQFNPSTMSDLIPRWEAIFSIIPFPNEELSIARSRIEEKFKLFHKIPSLSTLNDALNFTLPNTFVQIVNVDPPSSISTFPGGANIIGGSDSTNGDWYSNVSFIAILVVEPSWMLDQDFYNEVNQVYPTLNPYLPAYDTFDWFSAGGGVNGLSSEGANAGSAGGATISVSVGSTSLTGTGTHWNTVINAGDGTKNLVGGSQFLVKADDGLWYTLTVANINSDTSITLDSPAAATITNKHFFEYGFYLDEDPTQFPYPGSGFKNTDNAGLGPRVII